MTQDADARPARDGETFDVRQSDVLVLGCGAAGYQAAAAAARQGLEVCQVGLARGASPFILGFNTCLADGDARDSQALFFDDTFEGGYRLADPALVQALAQQAPLAFRELLDLGVPFAMQDGRPLLRHLSGSRYPRSVYVARGTGNAILRAVSADVRELGVQAHTASRVLSLLAAGGRVVGALAIDSRTQRLTAFLAGNTVLAMGGIGGIYSDSTYPVDVEGSSYSLALDAGATLRDMEFVQFEPTVVLNPPGVRGMEMPTAMLGDGAVLKNVLGERFMCTYNPGGCEKQIEKAKMALCIQREIDEGRGTTSGAVYFDATVLAPDCLQGYVTHYQRLLRAGLDPQSQPVEIHPAAHSLMGGVRIDAHCRSDVPGLLVCGEAAGGLHGASRIAGNGAADAITFGRLAGLSAAEDVVPPDAAQRDDATQQIRAWLAAAGGAPAGQRSGERQDPAVAQYVERVSGIMSAQFGIRRAGPAMAQGVASLRAIHDEIRSAWDGSPLHPMARARSIALVALTIAESALRREESRGAHYRTDFLARDDAHWLRSNLAALDAAGALVVR